ncbi:PREDICTED: uncharacterized protein LOC105450603 [Wasmannia auropunctata]|uniref:uncharacterized protein LOC105450603 n=1 Tax=Wasmannia auropunctata TaxID=64793 RepID=UPI0005EF2D38|nr:PREDICTED: uncharacterized protein LOC105450603 [Wasmannia auropunctata]
MPNDPATKVTLHDANHRGMPPAFDARRSATDLGHAPSTILGAWRTLGGSTLYPRMHPMHPMAGGVTSASNGTVAETQGHSLAPLYSHRRELRGAGTRTYGKGARPQSAQGLPRNFRVPCNQSRVLELVSDYSTDAFIAAFRRFVSRRGLCRALYSDRGTNFVGADARLRELFRAATEESSRLVDLMTNEGVEWKFNPPAAPHFGGLWEAAVKSVKHHLRGVIGDSTLTFEELTTVLTQIEACLNSRPLQAMTDDPEDLSALTPGHFLIGDALTAVPEPELGREPINRLTRWQYLQRMRDDFWARWSKEYLHTLNARSKWWKPEANPEVGDLCLIRGEAVPPCKWPLARIVNVHPGEDGQVRVVTARTVSTELQRPVAKLVLLPTNRAAKTEMITSQSM